MKGGMEHGAGVGFGGLRSAFLLCLPRCLEVSGTRLRAVAGNRYVLAVSLVLPRLPYSSLILMLQARLGGQGWAVGFSVPNIGLLHATRKNGTVNKSLCATLRSPNAHQHLARELFCELAMKRAQSEHHMTVALTIRTPYHGAGGRESPNKP